MEREVDACADEAIALLERAVNINSGSMNFDGVREVGSLFLEELAGAADASFTAGLVEMAIDGLGPGGNDHTVDEWIDLPTLALQTRRAAVLMRRLTTRPGAD